MEGVFYPVLELLTVVARPQGVGIHSRAIIPLQADVRVALLAMTGLYRPGKGHAARRFSCIGLIEYIHIRREKKRACSRFSSCLLHSRLSVLAR